MAAALPSQIKTPARQGQPAGAVARSDVIDRREFLGTMLAAGSLAACGGATPDAAVDLDGQLVLPSDPSYATARLLLNPRFDRVNPAAIALCRSVADVQRPIAFARGHDVPLAVRGGGHSYAGCSTGPGLVADVTGLAGVMVNPTAGFATAKPTGPRPVLGLPGAAETSAWSPPWSSAPIRSPTTCRCSRCAGARPAAAAVLSAWQSWGPTAPDELSRAASCRPTRRRSLEHSRK
ncbi:MAG: FAD-binding oxidoreductase [Egibacteraceae bacterium]